MGVFLNDDFVALDYGGVEGWHDISMVGQVPAEATGIIMIAASTLSTPLFKWRPLGSVKDYQSPAYTVFVELSGNQEFGLNISDDRMYMYIVGWTTDNTFKSIDFEEIVGVINNTWTTIDLSLILPAEATHVYVHQLPAGNIHDFGLRKPGSVDAYFSGSIASTGNMLVAELDDQRHIEIYGPDTSTYHILGYFTDNIVTGVGPATPLTVGTWTNAETTTNDALFVITSEGAGGSARLGYRPEGSTKSILSTKTGNGAVLCAGKVGTIQGYAQYDPFPIVRIAEFISEVPPVKKPNPLFFGQDF